MGSIKRTMARLVLVTALLVVSVSCLDKKHSHVRGQQKKKQQDDEENRVLVSKDLFHQAHKLPKPKHPSHNGIVNPNPLTPEQQHLIQQQQQLLQDQENNPHQPQTPHDLPNMIHRPEGGPEQQQQEQIHYSGQYFGGHGLLPEKNDEVNVALESMSESCSNKHTCAVPNSGGEPGVYVCRKDRTFCLPHKDTLLTDKCGCCQNICPARCKCPCDIVVDKYDIVGSSGQLDLGHGVQVMLNGKQACVPMSFSEQRLVDGTINIECIDGLHCKI